MTPRAAESIVAAPETPAAPSRAGRAELVPVAAAFLLSGAAGLVYQVAWQRILALHSGVGIYSIAMIVAAFMAGLGAGSHLGGVLSARMGRPQALRAFGLLEVAIGVFGALSCVVYYDWLYLRASGLYAAPWRAGLLHFLALFPPTCLMGMSLPFLVRAMVSDARGAGRTVGLLYGINIVGAALGALIAPWVLIRFFGIRGAVQAAAAANMVAGLGALALLARRPPREATPLAAVSEAPGVEPPGRHPFALWVGLYALSGFCALSLEIVWFRLVDLAVKATAYTFGTVLALYLVGMAIGCLIAAPRAHRLRRPLRTFLLCQCLLLAYSGVAVVLLTAIPAEAPLYSWFWNYWNTSNGFRLGGRGQIGTLLRLYVALPLLVFGLPTVLMGYSFPALQRAVQDDPRTSGRKVGILQAANIAGCVAGSLLVGLVALNWLGSTVTLRLLLLAGLVFAAVGIRRYGPRSVFAPVAALLVLLAFILPGQSRLWLRLHGTADAAAIVDEDATGVAAVIPRGPELWRVFVNGKNHSWLPFGAIHTRLGATPAVVHPAPVDVAIIGLGSGDTAWASGCRPETRSITVFEISGGQPRLLARVAAREELPDLRRFLNDPRLRVVVADGRQALNESEEKYDLIEADALWPEVAFSGNLYSYEFFARCARRLKPGGVMCTWSPTPRVYSSFVRAFPHVLGPDNRQILIGSNEPLPEDPPAWRERLFAPEVVSYLGLERAEDVSKLLGRLIPLHRTGRRHPDEHLNFDLFPRDEFQTP